MKGGLQKPTEFSLRKKGIGSYVVEWADSRGYILSKLNRLYFSADLNPPYRFIGAFPAPLLQRILARNRVAQRALRFMYYNVIGITSERIFVTFQKSLGVFENGEFSAIFGQLRPSKVLRGGCALDDRGGIYLGEYFSNDTRHEVNVYYLAPDSHKLEVVHVFEPGAIRHIHGLHFDPYEKHVWVVTGDRGSECRILRTKDHFKTLEVVGQGDETWRAVCMVFRKDAFYYATDAEFQQNHVRKIDRKTLESSALFEVDGPVYYAKDISDHIFFGSTAEGAEIQKQNRACLWSVDNQDNSQMVASYDKDIFPNIFMPGTLHFPLGNDGHNRLLFNCVGLSGVDNQTMEITF